MSKIAIYKNWQDLAEDLPGPTEIIQDENNFQYPNAKFIIAGIEDVDSCDPTLSVFFDAGEEGILWAWVAGDLYDEEMNMSYFIDEYFTMSVAEAEHFHANIFGQRDK